MATNATSTAPASVKGTFRDHYRWNAVAFMVDGGFFYVAMAFISATTVLPSLVAALSGSDVLVGLSSGLISGGWLLPQLVIASAVSRMHRRKPLVVRTAWIGRPLLLLLALAIWLLGTSRPNVTLAAVMIGIFIFFVFDAVVSVPWLDLLGKAIPATRRGRVLGISQVLGGIGGIGAGVIVRQVLADDSAWPFPTNYALLFALAGVLVLFSAVALSVLREPEIDTQGRTVPSVGEVIGMMPRILTQDKPYMRLIIVRLIAGFATLGNAFYVLHATKNLGLGIGATGLFVSAQVVGSLASGLVMSVVQDHWGPVVHIRLNIVTFTVPPVIALVAGYFSQALGPDILYPYLLVYFFLGLSTSSIGWPYFNWILEYAEERWRPLYLGMINTLAAIVMLAPTLGGWIASGTSYPTVFLLGMGFAAVALLVSIPLPSTRKAA